MLVFGVVRMGAGMLLICSPKEVTLEGGSCAEVSTVFCHSNRRNSWGRDHGTVR